VALDRPLRFGAFFAPFHPVGQNPTLAIEYDLQRTVELDRLGYDEVWFGEHHSGGYELIGCPEVFIAAAAERTRHVKLGTGVVSLPYHHPWLVADRLNLLDHLTRGRVIFGAGPGALPSDAYVMGIEPVEQRRMMEEALEAILALWRSDEPVSRQTDWFTMREARLQMRPYSFPHPEVAVAAMVSPSGPRLAGKHGVSLLSLSMSVAEGFAAVGQAWGVVEEMAARHVAPAPDRSTWRVLGTVHLAETRERAPGRDTGEGDRGLHLRAAAVRRLAVKGRVRAARQPGRRRAADPTRLRRGLRGVGQRRHRDAG
jgi:limonene 1,2-monooxygenase